MFRTLTSFLLAVALLVTAGSAQAFTNTPIGSDAELNDLTLEEIFVAEARIGNATNNGDWEYDLYLGGDNAEFSQQFMWMPGVPVDFTLSYDAILDTASFTFGGNTLNLGGLTGDINALAVRVRSDNLPIQTSALVNFDDPTITDVFAENGDVAINLIGGVGASFSLNGSITFDFDPADVGNGLQGSQLAVQIKGIQAVPVPGAVWLLGAGLAGLYARKRRA